MVGGLKRVSHHILYVLDMYHGVSGLRAGRSTLNKEENDQKKVN